MSEQQTVMLTVEDLKKIVSEVVDARLIALIPEAADTAAENQAVELDIKAKELEVEALNLRNKAKKIRGISEIEESSEDFSSALPLVLGLVPLAIRFLATRKRR